MKQSAISVLLTFLLFLAACSENDTILAPQNEGYYTYTSYDKNGRVIVEGWFDIHFRDSVTFDGSWHFIKIGNPRDTGPQVGQGVHTGSFFSGDSIWIELNPQFRDNNLQLVGRINDNIITGKWYWTTLIGITSQGTFVARK